jgi:hypothetical protein
MLPMNVAATHLQMHGFSRIEERCHFDESARRNLVSCQKVGRGCKEGSMSVAMTPAVPVMSTAAVKLVKS